MEPLDESSPPKRRLSQPVDITPTNITFDHDAWDIADAFPDVIRDIESSLKEAKPDSAAALLGLDIDLDDNDHFHRLVGSTYRDVVVKVEVDDSPMIEDTGECFQPDSRIKEESPDGRIKEEPPDGRIKEEPPDEEEEVCRVKEERVEELNLESSVKIEVNDSMMEETEDPFHLEGREELQEEEEEERGKKERLEEIEDDGVIPEEDNEEWMDDGASDEEMVVLDEDGDDEEEEENHDIGDELLQLKHSTSDRGSRKNVKTNNTSGLSHTNNPKTTNDAGGSITEGTHGEDGDDVEEEGDEEEEGEMIDDEWDSDSEGDLDALLDEGLPEQYKQSKGDGTQQGKGRKKAGEAWRKVLTQGALPEGLIGVKEKTVLKRRGQEPLEGLPDGWVRISHQCGMPLYLHRPSRVCTWSRPYLLGSGSARRHRVPVAAIPCMHYSRALEKEKKGESDAKDIKTIPSDLPNGDIPDQHSTCPKGENNQTNPDTEMKGQESKGEVSKFKKNRVHICEDDSVDVKDLQEYLSRIFQFEKIAIKRFKSWASRRKYTKAVKNKERPQFPGGPKVLRCQLEGNTGREFVINAQDKTPVCILHEYAQRVMRTQPQYVFGESRNASAPFEAVVEIKGVKYGRGEATSKRLAKAEAAKKTLDILVPELISDFKEKAPSDTEYFDHVAIDDIRIYDLCMKAGQLTPWQVLQEYIQRSHGMADTKFSMNIKLKDHQRSEYTLTLGPHKVTGMCKNKANGKQQGAQKLLKQLHPELRSWGAIIKMYGKGSSEINREKKEAELSVTGLTHNTPRAKPNRKILNKLRLEMMKTYGEKNWLDEEVERQKKQGEDGEQDMEEENKMECS
nr:microprocessor complex subunit DGCR8-like isoform X1 [Lytechinus pictus]